MSKLLRLAILLVAPASCGGGSSHKYPSQVRDNFMKSCGAPSGGSAPADKVCVCSFDAIQKKYTVKQFAAIEDKISQGGSPEELISIVNKCMEQSGSRAVGQSGSRAVGQSGSNNVAPRLMPHLPPCHCEEGMRLRHTHEAMKMPARQ